MKKSELLELKDQIAEAKTKHSTLQGKLEYLMTQLKTQFGCDSLEAAEKKQIVLEKKIAKIQTQIETGIKELEEKYELVEE